MTVHDCPRCGFAGPEDWFKQRLPRRIRKLVRENLAPLPRDQGARFWRKIEHAAQIAQWQAKPPREIADLYLKAAYVCAGGNPEYRTSIRIEDEKSNRLRAIEFFRRSLEAGDVPAAEVPRITYLVGELYRRVARESDAHAWLERAEALAKDRGIQWLVELSRQQRTDPQDIFENPPLSLFVTGERHASPASVSDPDGVFKVWQGDDMDDIFNVWRGDRQ